MEGINGSLKPWKKTPTLALCLHEQAMTKIHFSLHPWWQKYIYASPSFIFQASNRLIDPTSINLASKRAIWENLKWFCEWQVDWSRTGFDRSRTAWMVAPVEFLHCGGAPDRSRTAQQVAHLKMVQICCSLPPFAFFALSLFFASS